MRPLSIGDSAAFINLIGKAHDHNNTATEQEFYFANVELTKEVFNTFINSSAKLLVHVSSIAAAEEFESTSPLLETAICQPISWYGKTKRVAEEWLLAQELPKNKKLIILRPPMIHGEGDKGNLRSLYNLISKGLPYPLSSFDNKRSFISINNFCFLIEKIIQHSHLLASGIYHIADDEAVSTKEIIDIVGEINGRKVLNIGIPIFLLNGIAKIGDYLPIPLNSTRLKKMTGTLFVSNQKIKSALGIERLPLTAKDGLQLTIESFKHDRA